jgi:hypothetical protein
MSIILERSLVALKATGAKFIVVMPDGTTHSQGDLKLAGPERRKRSRSEHPHGSISAYYLPLIQNMQPGQMVEVPYDKFSPKVLVSGISSRAVDMWGRHSTITAQNSVKKVVEVLRVA